MHAHDFCDQSLPNLAITIQDTVFHLYRISHYAEKDQLASRWPEKKEGADFIEANVEATKGGQFIFFHDTMLHRRRRPPEVRRTTPTHARGAVYG
jgi:hypothetical protein